MCVIVSMKWVIKCALPVTLILALALLATVAQAMPGEGRFAQGSGNRPGLSQQDPNLQQEVSQQFLRRDQRDAGEPQRSPRLSPEERRQLRRDIHEAGRDIYLPQR